MLVQWRLAIGLGYGRVCQGCQKCQDGDSRVCTRLGQDIRLVQWQDIREYYRMLAAGVAHLTGPASNVALGATKRNIALVLMEACTDIDAVQRFCPVGCGEKCPFCRW